MQPSHTEHDARRSDIRRAYVLALLPIAGALLLVLDRLALDEVLAETLTPIVAAIGFVLPAVGCVFAVRWHRAQRKETQAERDRAGFALAGCVMLAILGPAISLVVLLLRDFELQHG
ncbi:MAG: hypothetical protein R3F34_09675 [Planctomycetota bacterium]